MGYTNLPGELATANSLPGDMDEEHGVKPFVQRDAGSLENRPCSDGELLPAGVALITIVLGEMRGARAVAVWTNDTLGPALFFEEIYRRLFVWVALNELNQADVFRLVERGVHGSISCLI